MLILFFALNVFLFESFSLCFFSFYFVVLNSCSETDFSDELLMRKVYLFFINANFG